MMALHETNRDGQNIKDMIAKDQRLVELVERLQKGETIELVHASFCLNMPCVGDLENLGLVHRWDRRCTRTTLERHWLLHPQADINVTIHGKRWEPGTELTPCEWDPT